MTDPEDLQNSPDPPPPPPLTSVYENRPEGYEGTCLRPLGLCELGGSCDTCWYGPDHPRHQEKRDQKD